MCGNLKAHSPPHTSFNDVLTLTDDKGANGALRSLFPMGKSQKSVSHQISFIQWSKVGL